MYELGLMGLIVASLIITFGLGLDGGATGQIIGAGGMTSLYLPIAISLIMVGAIIYFNLNRG